MRRAALLGAMALMIVGPAWSQASPSFYVLLMMNGEKSYPAAYFFNDEVCVDTAKIFNEFEAHGKVFFCQAQEGLLPSFIDQLVKKPPQ